MQQARRAWVYGGELVLTSTDAGTSWQRQADGAPDGASCMAFANPSLGFAGCGNYVVATTDGGATWSNRASEGISGGGLPVCGIAAGDAEHVWAVGEGIFFSSDGGASWVCQDQRECLDVASRDAAQAWVATGGSLLHTDDGGASWRAVQGLPTERCGLFSVACDDSGAVWAVGSTASLSPDAYVVWSRDGGRTWHSRTFPTDTLNDVALSGPARVWAVGDRARIYSSRDGGRHWRIQRVPRSADILLDGITFADELHGWAVGERTHPAGWYQGVIFSTTDGGATWTRQAIVRGTDGFAGVTCAPAE